MLNIQTEIRQSLIPNAGNGLFATTPIQKGQIIWREDKESFISQDTYNKMERMGVVDWLRKYGTCNAITTKDHYVHNWYLDKDNTRFMNHSSTPNVAFIGEVGVALMDISPYEELYCNYFHTTEQRHAAEQLGVTMQNSPREYFNTIDKLSGKNLEDLRERSYKIDKTQAELENEEINKTWDKIFSTEITGNNKYYREICERVQAALFTELFPDFQLWGEKEDVMQKRECAVNSAGETSSEVIARWKKEKEEKFNTIETEDVGNNEVLFKQRKPDTAGQSMNEWYTSLRETGMIPGADKSSLPKGRICTKCGGNVDKISYCGFENCPQDKPRTEQKHVLRGQYETCPVCGDDECIYLGSRSISCPTCKCNITEGS